MPLLCIYLQHIFIINYKINNYTINLIFWYINIAIVEYEIFLYHNARRFWKKSLEIIVQYLFLTHTVIVFPSFANTIFFKIIISFRNDSYILSTQNEYILKACENPYCYFTCLFHLNIHHLFVLHGCIISTCLYICVSTLVFIGQPLWYPFFFNLY